MRRIVSSGRSGLTAEGPWSVRYYSVYGVTLATDFPFTWPLRLGHAPADVSFTCRPVQPLDVDWTSLPAVHAVAASGRPEPDITYHHTDGLDVVRIHDVADHYVRAERIDCHLRDPPRADLVEIQLLGMVLATWLERRGTPTLHASCVVIDDAAVAFLGTKGGGKTTLATAFVTAGHPLLTDDLLALTVRNDAVLAQPGYPLLRLWPDQISYFVGDEATLPLVHPGFSKRRVTVGAGFGVASDTSRPLRRVYLPERTRTGSAVIEPVGARQALLGLVGHGFLREAVYGLDLAAERFQRLAAVLPSVEVRTLRFRRGFEHLPEAIAAVRADLTAG